SHCGSLLGFSQDGMPGLVGADPVPVEGDADAGAFRRVDAAVGVDGVQVVAVARVQGRASGLHQRVDQAQLVEVGVPDGGHDVPVDRAGAVEFQVEAEALGGVGDLHRAG